MARAGPTIFCFSGGVDTFHNLLTFPDRIETLAVLIGYAVDDAGRSGLWPPWRQACSLPSVAAGLQPAECGGRLAACRDPTEHSVAV